MRRRRLACAAVLAAGLLGQPALATWSIVVVNRKTLEVGVACATCIEDIDLAPRLPALRPGIGAGNVQAWWDSSGGRRQIMWNGMGAGDTPQEILDALAALSQHQSYQYGIASVDGPAVTFTGSGAQAGVCGITGEVGDLSYAIQGNVITGDPVCLEAAKALVETPGDMTQKLMAGMLAARAMGGDGRCSCSFAQPDGCGSPPPSFTKTAHTVFLIVSRMGDEEGTCSVGTGCVNGKYFLKRAVVGDAGDPDPILVLSDKVDTWRANQLGRPDHLLSEAVVDRQQVVADGVSVARVTVWLRDIDGNPLTHGGDTLTIAALHADPPPAIPGPVTDHGDGSYSFDLVATATTGIGEWTIEVDFGGAKPRLLWPPVELEAVAPVDLHAGFVEYPSTSDLGVPFTLQRDVAEAGRAYHLLGTAPGTVPGLSLPGVHVPLNRDRFFQLTWLAPGAPHFPGSAGVLDAGGRAEARLVLHPVTWTALVGERLDFVGLLGGATPEVTQLAGFLVVP